MVNWDYMKEITEYSVVESSKLVNWLLGKNLFILILICLTDIRNVWCIVKMFQYLLFFYSQLMVFFSSFNLVKHDCNGEISIWRTKILVGFVFIFINKLSKLNSSFSMASSVSLLKRLMVGDRRMISQFTVQPLVIALWSLMCIFSIVLLTSSSLENMQKYFKRPK